MAFLALVETASQEQFSANRPKKQASLSQCHFQVKVLIRRYRIDKGVQKGLELVHTQCGVGLFRLRDELQSVVGDDS